MPTMRRARSRVCFTAAAAVLVTGLPAGSLTQAFAATSVAGESYATTPTKILDTRVGLGAPRAALGAGRTLTLTVAGKGGVPATGAASATLQLTALSSTAATSLTVYPAGAARPATPNLYVPLGSSATVLLTSKLGGGRVTIYNARGTVQVLAHTESWSTTGVTALAGTRLTALSPAHILDTRTGLGAAKAKLGAARTLVLTVAGKGGVPATGVAAAAISVTGMTATVKTSLTVYPYGAARPATPNLYLAPGQTVAAAVVAKLGSGGRVAIYNAAGTVNVLADTQGAFRTGFAAGGRLAAVQPSRLVRSTVTAAHTLIVQVSGKAGVPATTAVAAAISVTGVASATAATSLTVYPYGGVRPATPNVYLPKGATQATAVLAKLGSGGRVAIYNAAGSTIVSVDTQAYYAVPVVVPPPAGPDTISTTGAHSLYEVAKFLFTGTNPAQTGVASTTIKADQIGVIRGKLSVKGAALPGVSVSILKHPEYWTTKTASDGFFSIAVNAGGPLVVNYALANFSGSQRQVVTRVGQYVWAENVVLVPLDTKVTTFTAKTATTTTAAISSTVTDLDGSRTNAVLFPAGTTVTAKKADGSTVTLPATLHVRATEYTAGVTGPAQMPGSLPASSAYTYATELSVDEATALGATEVDFSKELANYVDNFLNFPVGTAVPAGYYDRTKAVWVASKNGLVVKVVSTTSGMADLDVDGASGGAADPALYAGLGITNAERTRLTGVYPIGKSLWRVPITHFTPWDYNWPYGLPDDAKDWFDQCMGGVAPDAAKCKAQAEEQRRKQCEAAGSIIGCQNQTLDEVLPVAGTPFQLRYSSANAPGRLTDRVISIPLTFGSPPTSLRGVQLEIEVAGQTHQISRGPGANQSYTFTWDGLDGFGRPVNGAQDVHIRVGYEYQAVYKASPAALQASFALVGGADLAANQSREAILVWQTLTSTVGSLHPDAEGLGGWGLNVHHAYDPAAGTIHLGGGGTRGASAAAQGVIGTVRTTGVTPTSLDGMAAGRDGSIFVADPVANQVLKISPSGATSVFAGTGVQGYNGDGGPATAAQLYSPRHVTAGPDGSIYLTDGYGSLISRVRRITPDGVINTVAGTFGTGFSGDGGRADNATLDHPEGIAVGLDGSLYIADTGNGRVRRVNPDGVITTVAGNGTAGEGGDNGPARAAQVTPLDVAVGEDGTLFIASGTTVRQVRPDGIITRLAGSDLASPTSGAGASGQALDIGIQPSHLAVTAEGTVLFSEDNWDRVRSVTPDGRLTTVVGTGVCDATVTGDGAAANAASLCQPSGLALAPGGVLHIAENSFSRKSVRRIGSIWPGFQLGDTTLTDELGSQVWVFDANGRHKRTLDALTAAVVWQFGYDSAGRLTTITDSWGSTTTIARTAAGVPVSITAPGGQITTVSLDSAGNLASVSNPMNETTSLTYQAGGLLRTFTDPGGRTNTFTYDSLGRLLTDAEPDGTSTTLLGTQTASKSTVVVTRPGGLVTTHVDERLADGRSSSKLTTPGGSTYTLITSADELSSTLTRSDGTITTLTYAPDKRWGMQAPFASGVTVKLPSGKTITRTSTQSVTLSDPNNLLSLTGMTVTDTVDGKTTTTTYSSSTRTTTETSAAGRTRQNTIDARGRVTNSIAASGTDAISTVYESRGLPTSITQGSTVSSMTWDSGGRMATRTTSAGTEQFGYDGAGRLTSLTTSAGRQFAFGYDAVGNRTSITLPGNIAHTLTYTQLNQLASYQPPSSPAYTWAYTAAHDVAEVTLPSGAKRTRSHDAAGRETGISYAGAATAITYAAGSEAEATMSRTPTGGTEQKTVSTYDGPYLKDAVVSGPASGSLAYTYDNAGLLASIALDGGAARAQPRDDDGLTTGDGPFAISRTGPDGLMSAITDSTLSLSLGYDGLAHPTGRTTTVGAIALHDVQISWDSAMHVSGITEQVGTAAASTWAYGYDADGQLTSVTRDGTAIAAYSYDSRGNRTSSGDPASPVTASYDAQDRLTSSGGVSYSYDADGFLSGRGSDTFTYSARGELLAAHASGTDVTYQYDAKRRLTARTQSGVTTAFLYGNPYNETQVTASKRAGVTTEYFYDGGRHLYALQRGTARYYVATDQLGSPRVVSDSAGTVVDLLEYDAWGSVTSETDPTFDLAIGWAGGVRDKATGLVRFGLRDYEPGTGRWTSRDPALFDGGQANLYAYVGNSPLSTTDPTGLWGISLGGSICVLVCIEAKISVGSNGVQVCGGTGVGLGGGVEAGFTPGDIDTRTGIYAKASVTVGPVSVTAQVFQTVCGSSTTYQGCVLVACVGPQTFEKGTLTTKINPAKAGQNVGDATRKLGLSAKATIGGCVGSD